MAGTGPAPKDKRARDRDTKALEELVYDGKLFGDPLPEGILGTDEHGEPIDWHPQTLLLWESIREWPLMEHEPKASWLFLIDTMRLHHHMWQNGSDHYSEVRLRLAKYGIMPDDRLRIGVKYKAKAEGDPDGAPAAPARSTDDDGRRMRLVGGTDTEKKPAAKKKATPKKRAPKKK